MKIKNQSFIVTVSFMFLLLIIISTSVLYADDTRGSIGACCIKLYDDITCLTATSEECANQLGWAVFRGYDTDCLEGGCIPDCGDVNFTGTVNILDVIYILNFQYKCSIAPYLLETADVDGILGINILDAVYLIRFIYKDGADPICPGLQPERGSYQLIDTRDCK